MFEREKWETLSVKRNWPNDHESWTFKRCAGQNLVWALFGNDNVGVIPWFQDKVWTFWRWWLRNRFHNFCWYVIGYAWWEEGNWDASWRTNHLTRVFWVDKSWCQIAWIKPKKRCWLYWRPHFQFYFLGLDIHWGWGRRGQFRCAITAKEKKNVEY